VQGAREKRVEYEEREDQEDSKELRTREIKSIAIQIHVLIISGIINNPPHAMHPVFAPVPRL
jgi:hypothetical protein